MAVVTWSLLILYFKAAEKFLLLIFLALMWECDVLAVEAECPLSVSAHGACMLVLLLFWMSESI